MKLDQIEQLEPQHRLLFELLTAHFDEKHHQVLNLVDSKIDEMYGALSFEMKELFQNAVNELKKSRS